LRNTLVPLLLALGALPALAEDPPAPPPRAKDSIELGATTITGNRELPKVMYVVPWKRADIGDLAGKPTNSLLDEALAPVDRSVFRREVDFFNALESAAPQAETSVTATKRQP